MTTVFFPITKEGGEVVDRRESAWADPRTWVSIIAVLLTLSIAVGGLMINQLSSLNAKVEGLLVVTTKQGSDYDALKEQVRSMRDDIKALQEHDAGQERTIAEIRGATMAKKGK